MTGQNETIDAIRVGLLSAWSGTKQIRILGFIPRALETLARFLWSLWMVVWELLGFLPPKLALGIFYPVAAVIITAIALDPAAPATGATAGVVSPWFVVCVFLVSGILINQPLHPVITSSLSAPAIWYAMLLTMTTATGQVDVRGYLPALAYALLALSSAINVRLAYETKAMRITAQRNRSAIRSEISALKSHVEQIRGDDGTGAD